MLLFDPINDAIVGALSAEPSLSTQELHGRITTKVEISLPNFYKIVSRLVADQILIRENGKISLHARWIIELGALAEKLRNAYLESDSEDTVLKEGENTTYTASSLEELDGVWGDVMLAVNREYGPEESTYVYQAHPYYALGMKETETAFFRQVLSVSPVYFLTGNSGFLDRLGMSAYEEIGIPAFADETTVFPQEGYCVTVIGDYIFEVIYPPVISEYFRLFFDTVTDTKGFNPELFRKIFAIRSRCKLTLRRSAKNAQKVREGFLRTIAKR